jgi:hypothetical protein
MVQDHLSEIIFLVIGAAAGAFFGWLFWKSKQPNSIDWNVALDTPVLFNPGFGHDKSNLKVLWGEDYWVAEPRIIIVRIINTGRSPVTREELDHDKPITFSFRKSKLVEVTEFASDKGVEVELGDYDVGVSHSIIVRPKTLRPGEWLGLRFLVARTATRSPVARCSSRARLRG